ncbi:MAG: hypothetical protein AB7N99_00915 [Simkaniaceae bacterium]
MGMFCLPCNALFQGVGSGIWAWTMGYYGCCGKNVENNGTAVSRSLSTI